MVVYGEGRDGPKFRPEYIGKSLRESRHRRLPWRTERHQKDEEPPRLHERVLVVLHGHVAAGKTSTASSLLKDNQFELREISSDAYWFKHGTGNRDKEPEPNADHNWFMIQLCWSVLGSGHNVVLDSTTRSSEHRKRIQEEFEKWNVTVIFIRCRCSEQSALERIKKRLYIGKTDFGDYEQYERIKTQFVEIGIDEEKKLNILDVNTDTNACKITHSKSQEATGVMDQLIKLIDENYLKKTLRIESHG